MQSKTENHTMRVFYLLAIVFVVMVTLHLVIYLI